MVSLKIKAVLMLLTLGVGEARRVDQDVMKRSLDSIAAGSGVDYAQVGEMMNALAADPKLQEQAKYLSEEVTKAMMDDPNLQEQTKLLSEEVAKMQADPGAPGDAAEKVSSLMEKSQAMMANPKVREQVMVLAAMLTTNVAREPSVAFASGLRPGRGLTRGASATTSAARAAPQMIDKSKKIPNKNVYVTFAATKEVQKDAIISGFQYGQEIAIINEKGKIYAMSNKLPPTGQPATFGTLSGDGTIREPISGTKFSLKTGQVVGPWCPSAVGSIQKLLIQPSPVQTFPVKSFGGKVQVQINVNAKEQFEQNYWRGVLDSQGKTDGGYY